MIHIFVHSKLYNRLPERMTSSVALDPDSKLCQTRYNEFQEIFYADQSIPFDMLDLHARAMSLSHKIASTEETVGGERE